MGRHRRLQSGYPRGRPHLLLPAPPPRTLPAHIVGENDAYAQTVQVIRTLNARLVSFGATLEHVVRTRMFVTDIKRWEEYGRAHGEFFAKIKPCATMVEVRALIDPRMLIEIEVDAEL